uniref:MAM domain-containing protein n=1 Tax=Steinernema glaseri TaxID=37863 RepID=A0A1I7XXE6_9BILA
MRWSTTVLLSLAVQAACLSTAPRQYAAGPTVNYNGQAPPIPPPGPAPARAAAAAAVNKGPTVPISVGENSDSVLSKASITEFSAEGYNSESGGPIDKPSGLSCDFDGKPCCWANVATPEDQFDWQVASGPVQGALRNASLSGSYLVAYANSVAPSDEAQFASCGIYCASSPIRVRASHYQSSKVLLQVCQKESYPTTANYNPLLNCQEFPRYNGLGYSELVLPKASLVDIVFVASNFEGDADEIALLDNIEIFYDTNDQDCQADAEEVKTRHEPKAKSKEVEEVAPHKTSVDHIKAEGNQESVSTSSQTGGDKKASVCEDTKCTFEGGNTCSFKDAHQSQSIRGLTTRFQVVTGQFMNRVTGVKEGTEGNYYAATFLYPREMAGLEADVSLPEDRRMRFQYYEGTHGVQLKGCCNSTDNCPFSSDKFVSVQDRRWKYASLVCPKGTNKVIFVCENTRTNQGACAIDDIQVVENVDDPSLQQKTLC